MNPNDNISRCIFTHLLLLVLYVLILFSQKLLLTDKNWRPRELAQQVERTKLEPGLVLAFSFLYQLFLKWVARLTRFFLKWWAMPTACWIFAVNNRLLFRTPKHLCLHPSGETESFLFDPKPAPISLVS
jgi:glucan phosphoethanolaminetransferase (alkaline phosphatase superfamily)